MTTTLTQPSIRIEKPFDQALVYLEERGSRIITLADNARLRIQEGPSSNISHSNISQYGNHVREDFIYRPKERSLLVRRSPILDSPVQATEDHRSDQEFYPSKDQIERAIASGSYELPDTNFNIPTNRFDQEGLTVFAFGTTEGKDRTQDEKDAKEYGLFLRENGINEMPVLLVDRKYVNKQDRSFARKLWFRGLGGRSGLSGSGRSLDCNCWVRGVPKETGEASPQKIAAPTLEERIRNSLEKGESLELNGKFYNLNDIKRE